ncbi:metalloregulator ArsR/SmtB family transcription factor [Fodinisporobacter ferrooxydans]|uniref:Metalloregulator ArsR/SmtB family transcription factor n=1 Tax=Fodinisporobacter ferrooxydans TaxID=2901836 RepID=A0ABY4CGV6_9BACL|nr:metalloregulator ArsR/SmtB family transcription factor [Alicyclobacillaceae bacterium MYW30-H2]
MPHELQIFKAEFFKALSNPLRIRILELLRDGDKYVHELQEHMNVDSSVVSQQLSILRNKDIVYGSKDGAKVMYTVVDPIIFDMLDLAKQLFNNRLKNTIQLLEKIDE